MLTLAPVELGILRPDPGVFKPDPGVAIPEGLFRPLGLGIFGVAGSTGAGSIYSPPSTSPNTWI